MIPFIAGAAIGGALFFFGINPLIAVIAAVGVAGVLFALGGAPKKSILHTTEWRDFPLIEKDQLSPNTAKYRFGLPRPDDALGLPIGQHISLMAIIDGKECFRSYTPTTLDDTKGYFELVVKVYPQGNMSKYLDNMKIGDKIKVRGPKGFMKYTPNLVSEIGMLAGGTGITPMYQVALAALRNPADKTKFSLIYANNNEEDILLKDELDALAKKHPGRFSVYYVLLETPKGWSGGKGFVTKEMIAERLPNPTSNSKIFICGPPPMVKAMTGHTTDLGFPPPQAISKMDDVVFKF